MTQKYAVGIDLGTTYSTIAYLNEHGDPIAIPNADGEVTTPSVVLFEDGKPIVGTEALRNSVRSPANVVTAAKRFMDQPSYRWKIDGQSYSPIEISSIILRSLLDQAEKQLGLIERAVITVPAQFSDQQREATAEAGRRAGLRVIDIINEPVAAALCYVIGEEGVWFTELANDQRILVVDLGGGTFDLSLVSYKKNEVKVIASGGDLKLGGIDWNNVLLEAISKQFQKEFGVDARRDRESLQALSLEVEQTKRSLSVRPKAALLIQHAGFRKTYQVEQPQFERLAAPLLKRASETTQSLLRDNKMGWAHVDVVLTTGGASRMPMVQNMLKDLAGYKTINSKLSPDLSVAHGAAYYAGMLLTDNDFAKSLLASEVAARLASIKQTNVNARSLGILVRPEGKAGHEPHWLIPANTPLPASGTQVYGTVMKNQKRARLRVVEGSLGGDQKWTEVGECQIEGLPEGLPEGSEIDVVLKYDEQARVRVEATVQSTGQKAHAEIVRPENLTATATPAVKPAAPRAAGKAAVPTGQPAMTRPTPTVAAPANSGSPNPLPFPAEKTSSPPLPKSDFEDDDIIDLLDPEEETPAVSRRPAPPNPQRSGLPAVPPPLPSSTSTGMPSQPAKPKDPDDEFWDSLFPEDPGGEKS